MFNLHYRLERKTIYFLLAIIGVASIGGAVDYPVVHDPSDRRGRAEHAGLYAARNRGP
jgi:hypothetical protein